MEDEKADLLENNELIPLLPAADPNSSHLAAVPDSDPALSLKGWFQVDGMTCSACSSSVEAVLMQLNGVSGATVDLLQNRVEVIFEPRKIAVIFTTTFKCQKYLISSIASAAIFFWVLPVFAGRRNKSCN